MTISERGATAVLTEAEVIKRAAAGKSYWVRVRERLLVDRLTLVADCEYVVVQ